MKKSIFFIAFIAMVILTSAIVDNTTDFEYKGKVVDTNGDPLIGATVLIKGTANGVATDFDGLFTLSAKDSCVVLIAFYVGFESTEKEFCSDGQSIVITLQEGGQLSEIVVTGLCINKEKRALGYAVTGSNKSTRRERRRAAKKRRKMEKNNSKSYSMMPTNRSGAVVSPSKVFSKHISKDVKVGGSRVQRRDSIDDTTNESYDEIVENPFIRAEKEPLSTFSIDVDAASYSNIRRFINNDQVPTIDAVRIEEMINYFDYDYPEPKGDDPFEIVTEVSDCPWAPDHKLLHVGLQGKHIATENLPTTNLVFLLDVSGSMGSYNKLPLLKESLSLLIDNMREEDKVTIVVYAGAAGLVLPATSGTNKNKIKEALNNLKSGGSTAGGAGIQLAYKMARESFVQGGNNRVILATDGDFNVGVSNDDDLVKMIEKERNSGVFLTVLGFGMGNYKDSKMQQLANKGNGNHAYIDNIQEAKKVLVKEFGGTLFTIAKDVKLQLQFNATQIAGYRLIGYENRLLANEDFDDDTKDAGELGAGHTVTALYEIIPAGVESTFLTTTIKGHAQIETLEVKKLDVPINEWVNIKFRYKKPTGRKSQLIERSVSGQASNWEDSSVNYRWSAAVAEFGMMLRDSKYKGSANWINLLESAKAAKGKDKNGYRQEMIELIEKAKAKALK